MKEFINMHSSGCFSAAVENRSVYYTLVCTVENIFFGHDVPKIEMNIARKMVISSNPL